ncbi:hypothetical protein DBR11_20990 [Pedobacter sp. HMWF019]|uniref:NACHT domain-containing protein n=1 Tax=Pedobacter sp. HMWF019 TaxID=2056856 RepID=UPI000D380371|nr:hypothetical protein [Pedobacter sp. HMWF019]PTS95657.1 hypothetical protein DBR11_20990 [Pedobacter sp. HMWF019]
METLFIPQYYQKFETLQDYLDDRTNKKTSNFRAPHYIEPSALFDQNLLFVIAEPGHGKSMLFKQLEKSLIFKGSTYQLIKGIDEPKAQFKADVDFLLFDALDEDVNPISTFNSLKSHCKDHRIKLLISNRSHYMGQITHLLWDANTKLVKLLPFDEYQITRFLSHNLSELDFSHEDIEAIISATKAGSNDSILKVPRYLNEICRYLIQENVKPFQLKTLTKSHLFDKVIYFKLESEQEEGKENQKYMTKRVLERLALTMEIQGVNKISKEDFITFLDQTNSNISLIFLNMMDIDILLKRVMKSTGEMLQFEHTEFQEYLAAKELSRLGYRFQTIYDLMIDTDIDLLRPNWVDVLNFAIDIEPEFLRPMISFIESGKYRNVDEKLLEILVGANIEKFDEAYKDHCFEAISVYYTKLGRSTINIAGPLSKFIATSNPKIAIPMYPNSKFPDTARVKFSNQILLIEALASRSQLTVSQKQTWIPVLIGIIREVSLFSMHRAVYYALISIGEAEPVLKQVAYFERKPDYMLNEFLRVCYKLAPNDKRTVGLIKRCLKKSRKLNNLDFSIDNLSQIGSIYEVIKVLCSQTSILRDDSLRMGSGFHTLFERIEELDNPQIHSALKKLLLTSFREQRFYQYFPKFIDQSARYMLKKDKNILPQLLKLESFLKSADEIVKSYATELTLDQFQQIEQKLLTKNSPWMADRIVIQAKLKLEKLPENTSIKNIQPA